MKNRKCKNCGHVCGSLPGIITHIRRKHVGREGDITGLWEKTSEPTTNLARHYGRQKTTKKQQVQVAVVFPRIIEVNSNRIIHPGSVQIVNQ